MPSRAPFYFFVFLLLSVGIAATYYRHITHEVPWTPGEKRESWTIDAKVEFSAGGEPVLVKMATPITQPGYTVLHQNAASPGYGLAFEPIPNGGQAVWSVREASGKQTLYYKVSILTDELADFSEPLTPPAVDTKDWVEPSLTAAQNLLDQAWAKSADNFTLTQVLLAELLSDNQSQDTRLVLESHSETNTILKILGDADVPTQLVKGLFLEDGRRRQELVDFLMVFNEEEWQLFNLKDGSVGRPANLLLWSVADTSSLDVVGGKNSKVTFSMIRNEQPAALAVQEKLEQSDLMNFSIHSLPLEEQALFKGILLIPLGVMVVVLLRVLIGIKTSGTFMPVLIAMAFVQTSLVTGLVGFILVVGMGLIIRSYLSHLNLLLVARISAVIITVIAIIAIFSVFSFKLGLTEGLKITFFPMIILSWTIERMSILWEEEGPKEVLMQGGGSLLVAVLVYLTISNDLFRHLAFNFLGLQLVLMAFVLMLGNYTGYRLLELRRFKPLAKES